MANKDKLSTKHTEDKKENPFLVPDGYFENFSARLQDKLSEHKPSEERSHDVRLKPYIYSTISIAAIFMLVLVFFRITDNNRGDTGLTNSEIAVVLEADVYDLEESYLIDNYAAYRETEELIHSNEADPRYKDEIIQYLLDEDVEMESIVNEL